MADALDTKNPVRPRRRLGVVVLTVLLAVVAWYVGSFVRMAYRSMRGEYGAADYLWLKGYLNPEMTAHFPAAIPPDARNVHIFAPGIPWAPMPTSDHMMELRMDVAPSEAKSIAHAARVRNDLLKDSVDFDSWAGLVSRLHTASVRPLTPAFNSYMLGTRDHRGPSLVGVSVNTTSGEVIYWLYD